jgi:hypothetical protein
MERDKFICQVWEWLEQAQNHYKLQYDRNHRELEFHPRDWVWLPLLHRLVASLNVDSRGKLGPKFYEPFQVRERVDDVTYKLLLPLGTKLHGTFHVGLLKRFYSAMPSGPRVLPLVHHGRACLEPAKVIKSRLARGHHELLIRWTGQTAADAAWMDFNDFWCTYLSFQLADELILQSGRDIMTGIHYQRRGKKGKATAPP